MDTDVINSYLAKSERELYQELGATLLGSGPGFGPSDAARFLKFGKKWFEDRFDDLRVKLCRDGGVRALIEARDADRAVQVATLVEILATIEGQASHTLLVTVLVTKFGVTSLCHGLDSLS